jgi:PD-(D/E)XK nuclease superfamily
MENAISHKIIGAAIEVHKVLGGPGLLDIVIVEVKAVEKLHTIHEIQLLTYLRLTARKLGLLINFGQEYVKDGISRVVNGI